MFDREAGYAGIGPEKGIFVEAEEAFAYALERCLHGTPEERKEFEQEFRAMIVEWYYSGNWIETKGDR